jgi:hypothetical protein
MSALNFACICLLMSPQELQHQMGLFYQHTVTLNTFLVDSLTLEQTLLLNVACEWTCL